MLAAMNQTVPAEETEPKTQYRSYLLRLWRADVADSGCWQASLEESHTRERIGFGSLEELFAYLLDQAVRDGE